MFNLKRFFTTWLRYSVKTVKDVYQQFPDHRHYLPLAIILSPTPPISNQKNASEPNPHLT